MERIVYNSKLKKILFSMLIVMILLQVMMPCVVFAASETKTYNDWIKNKSLSFENKVNEMTTNYLSLNVFDWEKDETERNAKVSDFINERGNTLEIEADNVVDSLTGSSFNIKSMRDIVLGDVSAMREHVLKASMNADGTECKSYQEMTELIVYIDGETVEKLDENIKKVIKTEILDENVDYMGTTSVVTEEELKERDAERAEMADLVFQKYKNKLEIWVKWIKYTAVGEIVGYSIENITIPGMTEEQIADAGSELLKENEPATADIGGILLSPIFYLINFIADAIIDSLGKIMTSDGVFGSGIGILQMSPVTSKYTNTSELEVYISNIGILQYPNITYTPEEIFSGEIDLLSIDFISGKSADGSQITGDWATIRTVIAQWYKILRMIAIIGLLSVLIYTGIKVIISANAKDKAKYKEWIINWFMAVAILFTMHYIMSFIVSVTGEFSQLLGNSCQGITVKPAGEGSSFEQFDTNLMGLVRFMVQSEDFYTKIAYEVMYIALIVYTVKFSIVYLKRVLNMAFLTLIAPIVALTYPIDKINDGQAQGFNMWLKEYIFNALLQPMHLIMYYILMGSAVSIAASNPLYGIVVLMFMTEAEKLLKKIFGFDKAGGGTVGGMTGAFAAGALASQVGRLAKQGANMIGGNGGKGGSGGGSTPQSGYLDKPKPTDKDSNKDNELFDDPASENSGSEDFADDRTPQQQMVDVEDDKFGTDEYDAEMRDKMARESDESEGMQYSKEDYRKIFEDQGLEGEELDAAMRDAGFDWSDEDEAEYIDLFKNQLGLEGKDLEEHMRAAGFYGWTNDENSDEGALDSSGSTGNNGAIPSQGAGSTGNNGATPSQGAGSTVNSGRAPSQGTGSTGNSSANSSNAQSTPQPTTRRAKFAKGAKAVGTRLAKPVWDSEKGAKYNTKRWAKRIGKAAFGTSVGIAAATVQAGISITDGKYNPMEGAAAFAGGYIGGGQVAKGVGSLVETFREGADEGDKQAIMKRAQEKWGERDDVINHNKKYDEKDRKNVLDIQKKLLEQGVNDIGEMDSCIKYMKKSNNESLENVSPDLIRKARVLHDLNKELASHGMQRAPYDPDLEKKWIETQTRGLSGQEKDREEKRWANKFNALRDYHNAQN